MRVTKPPNAKKDQGPHPGAGEHDDIGAQHRCDCSAGPQAGDGTGGIEENVRRGSRQASGQVEKQVRNMAENIFDIIAKDQ